MYRPLTACLAALLLLPLRWSTAADDSLDACCRPPAELAEDTGGYRSPLVFDNGRSVATPADWQQRRGEIRRFWMETLGAWPPRVEHPRVEVLETAARDEFTQLKLRFQAAADLEIDGYLLVPPGGARDGGGGSRTPESGVEREGAVGVAGCDRGPPPQRLPAVLVVYYDAEAGAGLNPKAELRDFGAQLARRGFVTLSIGWPREYTERQSPRLQPLSCLAYIAANCHSVLADRPEVDPRRIGIVGHSFGGKWAMFASCLYDRFACAAWSDPGIVFDETRPNVNYWEPWYLGWEAGRTRERGLPTADNPRTGPYRMLIESGHDLHELHALMAPRPFLVSGGAEDGVERWRALNHAVAVNRLLGCEQRVAMTNRPGHPPTEESNEQIALFFERWLKPNARRPGA